MKTKIDGDVRSREVITKWFKQISSEKSLQIIDTGAGAGHYTIKLSGYAKTGTKFIITDIDDLSLKLGGGNEFEIKDGIEVERIILDLQKPFKFANKTFDVVISTGVLEHLVDTDLYLAEVNRILKDDGNLLLLVPNLSALQYRLLLLFGKQPTCLHPSMKQYNSPISGSTLRNIYYKHVSVFTHKGLLEFITDYNFKIVKQKTAIIYFIPKFLQKIITFLRPYGIFSLVWAKKISSSSGI